ncbi:MAG TPA: sugar ABC transporter permease [Gaiellaceae bacterium]|nr:sugar ABC transporter permease [Gaiellaceae bacterium]
MATTQLAPRLEVDGAPPRRRRAVRLSLADRVTVALMVGIPMLIVGFFIWFPTISSIILSFSSWDGIGGLHTIQFIGTRNYHQIATIYPPFWPAFKHNIYWLAFLALIATPFGILLAYLLDKEIRGSRIYQSIFFLPVVLSLAVIGFIWELIYSPTQGLLNNLFEDPAHGHLIDWLGNPKINLWAILVAAGWRHAGYVMIIYLAGLKAVDPSLREAAAIDGAGEWHAFRTVVFPAMKPINIVIAVITVIEALRAFDIVYIINNGRNGLELLSVLVTDNIIGEASRIGYGSAIAVILLVISLIPISIFVANAFSEKRA